MLADEMKDARLGRNEGVCQLRERRVPDDHEQADAMPHDRGKFVGLVANPAIMGDGHPAALADGFQPLFVRAVGREVVCMTFDGQAGVAQDVRKFLAQIAVGEEYRAHAMGA